jgi:hypothetical protein
MNSGASPSSRHGEEERASKERRPVPPGVWRTFATYLLNVLGAAAAPLAAGIWFSDALGLRRIVPENATAWRGFAAAGAVALALTAFGSLDGAGVGGAIKRGLALGAASVGGAAGATISTIFALFAGAIGCCYGGRFDPESLEAPGDDASHFTTPEAALYVLISVGAPLLGFVLSCRLWWLATRASKTAVYDRPLALELLVALAVAATIVAAAGGLRHAGSPFALIVLLFVVVGHARGSRPAAAPSAGGSPP